MLLPDLPADLVLLTLSKLSIGDIHSLCLANQTLLRIIKNNEDAIYHGAAIFHQLTQSGKSLSQAIGTTSWLEGVSTWKQLCQKHFELEARWHGQGIPPDRGLRIGKYLAPGLDVFTFKIDEEEGTIISTTASGGLNVATIESDELLWSLPKTYVPEHSQIEWSNGFLVCMDEESSLVEVWRRSTDAYSPEKYLPCQPNEQQLAIAPLHPPTASPSPNSVNPGRRGVYIPFAAIQVPYFELPYYAFTYPNLAVASEIDQRAFIWDIRSGCIIETLDIEPHTLRSQSDDESNEGHEGTIQDLAISSDHLFVCWDTAMVVYQRRPGNAATKTTGIFSISSPPVLRPRTILGGHFDQYPILETLRGWGQSITHDETRETVVKSQRLVEGIDWSRLEPTTAVFDHVKVSPDGKDLVLQVSCYNDYCLLYVQDFARKIEAGEHRASFRMHLTESNVETLDFDGRRIVFRDIYANRCHLFILTLDDIRKRTSIISEGDYPTLTRFEESFKRLRNTNCTHFTDTRVWLTHDQVSEDGRYITSGPYVTYVDMTSMESLTT